MATQRQKKAVDKMVENGGNISKAMVEAGYSPATAKTPQKLTDSDGFKELMAVYLSDAKLIKKHDALLNSHKMEHMTFPLGPEGEDDINFSGAKVTKKLQDEDEDEDEGRLPEEWKERTTLTDKEIIEMLAEINCKVRRIVHGETARHVYFWAPDSMAQDKALDKAYKLKGAYAPEKSLNLSIDMEVIGTEGLIEIANKLNGIERNNIRPNLPSDGVDTDAVDEEVQD